MLGDMNKLLTTLSPWLCLHLPSFFLKGSLVHLAAAAAVPRRENGNIGCDGMRCTT